MIGAPDVDHSVDDVRAQLFVIRIGEFVVDHLRQDAIATGEFVEFVECGGFVERGFVVECGGGDVKFFVVDGSGGVG